MTWPEPTGSPAKERVRQAFEQAATRYDAVAEVQREMADHLALLLTQTGVVRQPATLLDAGCGTGYSARQLTRHWPHTRWVLLDFAPAMLVQAQAQQPTAMPVCADLEALPFGEPDFDGYWSSLAWQWNDVRRCLTEAGRVVAVGGWLAVATLGADNFPELRHAFAEIDGYQHVLTPPSVASVLENCRTTGWAVRVWRRQVVRRYFADLRGALQSIKVVGAHQVAQRRPQLLSRRAWRDIERRYEQLREAAGLPLSYDGILLVAIRS